MAAAMEVRVAARVGIAACTRLEPQRASLNRPPQGLHCQCQARPPALPYLHGSMNPVCSAWFAQHRSRSSPLHPHTHVAPAPQTCLSTRHVHARFCTLIFHCFHSFPNLRAHHPPASPRLDTSSASCSTPPTSDRLHHPALPLPA